MTLPPSQIQLRSILSQYDYLSKYVFLQTRKAVKHVSALLERPWHVAPGPVRSLVNVTEISLQGMMAFK